MFMRTARACAVAGILFTDLCAAQSLGSAGSVTGTVTDPSGAMLAGAIVSIENPVSHYKRSIETDASGSFKFNNVPFSHYHIVVAASGFQPAAQDTEIRTSIPITVNVTLQLAARESSVTVSADGGDLVESVPTANTAIDEKQFTQLPLTNTAAGLSDVITMSAPGVVADSNGMFHPLGDHGQTSYMVDNQPISDQQSKQFSTQLPENAVQSLEIIEGAPLAEYGDKTSLVVNTVTKSGLGQKPFGSIGTYLGSFGTYGENATYGFGGQKFGNFLAANSSRTGHFLDTPGVCPQSRHRQLHSTLRSPRLSARPRTIRFTSTWASRATGSRSPTPTIRGSPARTSASVCSPGTSRRVTFISSAVRSL